jgi:hypothetical protein
MEQDKGSCSTNTGSCSSEKPKETTGSCGSKQSEPMKTTSGSCSTSGKKEDDKTGKTGGCH